MGRVRHNLDHVRRLKAKLHGNAAIVVLEDGTRRKLGTQAFYDNFLANALRMRAAWRGEEVPPPHEVGEALKEAVNPLPDSLEKARDEQQRIDRWLEEEKSKQC